MNHYKYDVSLRIRHPKISAATICESLGLKTKFKWNVGEPRKTPNGTVLEGTRDSSYCCFEFEHPEEMKLSEFIRECNKKLFLKRDFLNNIYISGGISEYFIGWYSGPNSGEVFDLDLLTELVELKIELALDVYGEPETND